MRVIAFCARFDSSWLCVADRCKRKTSLKELAPEADSRAIAVRFKGFRANPASKAIMAVEF
jgi:hypothetical protein